MRVPSDVLHGLLRPRPAQPCARERAARNRGRVLHAVAEFGHLRCADLAVACWPGAACGLQMAQRTVRTLIDAGELMARANSLGGTSYVLARRGAAMLELRGIAAHHGLDLAVGGPTFRHASLTTRWCLHKRGEGFAAFNEYALGAGRAPLTRAQLLARYGKAVDAVLVKGDALWLAECESAPKSTAELMRICALAEHVGARVHAELPYLLAGVCIVFAADENHGARIARAARERWWRLSATTQATLASRLVLCRVDLGLPLVWRGCSEAPLTL